MDNAETSSSVARFGNCGSSSDVKPQSYGKLLYYLKVAASILLCIF